MKQTARKHKKEVLCTGKNKQMCLVSLLTRKPKQISKQEGSLTGPPPPLCNLFVPREKLNFGLWRCGTRYCELLQPRTVYESRNSEFAARGHCTHLQRAPLNTTQRARGSSTPPPVCAAAGLRTYTRAAGRAVPPWPVAATWPLPLARCAAARAGRIAPGPARSSSTRARRPLVCVRVPPRYTTG